MAASAPRLAWLRTFLFIVIILVVPTTLYFFLYAAKQGANAERRGFRALERLASHMQAEAERRTVVLATAAWGGSPPPAIINDDATIVRALKGGKILERDSTVPPFTQESSQKPTPAGSSAMLLSQISLGGTPELRLGIRLLRSAASQSEVPASAPLRDLVDLDLIGNEFDGLIVRRIGDPQAIPDDLLFEGNLPNDVVVAIRKHEAKLCDATAPGGAAPAGGFRFIEVPSAKLARTDYHTFCIPVDLQAPTQIALAQPVRTYTVQPLRLEIIGLVEAGRLRKQALQLSATTFGMIGIGTAAAFLLLPYLKVRFMVRRERMRAIDMWMLAAAAFLGTALGMLAVLHLRGHQYLQADVDAQLHALGEKFQANVTREVTLIRKQLLDGGVALAANSGCIAGGKHTVGSFLISSVLPDTSLNYPDFEALFCTDDRGQQVRKWMTRRVATAAVSIADYPFFARTMHMPESGANFEFDVIGAKTTGLELAVFAMPVDASNGRIGPTVEPAERTGVVVLATRPHALMAAELPKPYQYVVIRDDKLLFGSPGMPPTTTLFFTDIDGGATLQQVIRDARPEGSQPGDWRYRGRMHRIQAFKLHDIPATLLVFYDKTLIEGVSGEVLAASAFWVLLLAGACGLAIIAARALSASALDWLWPTSRNWQLYMAGALGITAFAVLFVAVSAVLPVRLRAFALVLVPALVVFALPWLPAPMRRAARALGVANDYLEQAWRRRLHPRLYLGFAVLILLALAAVPTALIFSDALRAYRAAFQHLSAGEHAARVHAQGAREAQRFVPAGYDCPKDSKDSDAAECQPDRVPIKPDQQEQLAGLSEELSNYALWPADETAPASSSSCRAVFSFSFGPTQPQTYFSTRAVAWLPPSSELNPELHASLCTVDAKGIAAAPSPVLPSALLNTVLPLILLMFVLWIFVRSIAFHILGLNFEGDGVLDRSQDALTGGRWLVLRPTAAALEKLKTAFPGLTVFDLADSKYAPAPFPKKLDDSAAELAPNAPLLLLHVESRLADKTWRKAILDCLDGPPGRAPIFLVSAIDPLHFLAGQLADAAPAAQAELANERQQWAHALTTVDKARYPRPQLPPAPACGDAARRCPLTVQRLADECQWNDVLLDIRQQLLKRDDFSRLDWNDIVERIQDLAEPYYRALWGLCSVEERLTMIQLAQEGVVNPRAFDVLRRLRRRRLIRADPRFRLMNESFRKFVLEAETPAQVKEWETPEAGPSWGRVQAPLLTLLFVLTAVLFYAQQPFFNSTVALVAGAAGAVSSLTGIFAKARQVLSPTNTA